MATLGTPFKRSHAGDLNIFDVLDDCDDTANSSPIAIVSQQPAPVLSEIAANNGLCRVSPDDLALQLEDFHIVTPAKINKTRGLKPRPTIDQSTFDFPTEEQENSKLVREGGGPAPSETAPEAPEESFTQNFLAVRNNDSLPSDSTQLAKHQAGEFEFVLSLPALTTTAGQTATNDTSSTETPEAGQEIATVQFGCNLVRADGTSDLARRNVSDLGNTYTLLVTPIEGDEKTASKIADPVAEQVDDMATAAVTKVAEIPTLPQAETTVNNGEPSPRTRIESLLGIGEPSKSAVLAQVTEIPVAQIPAAESPLLPQETDKPESNERMQGAISITTGEVSSDHGMEPGNNSDHGSRRVSDVSASQPFVQHDNHSGYHLGAIRKHSSRRTSEVLSDDKDDVIDEIMSLPPAPSPSSRIEDSVEALDKLEEQFEALNEVERALSVEAARVPLTSTKPGTAKTAIKRTEPGPAKPATKSATSAVRSKTVGRSASVRHSIAVPPSKQTEQNSATQAAASKRLSVISRPASLAPPKPLVRSSKPPTTSTFELPGEAVAQRLKEKRLARLSMSMPASAQTPGRTSSPTKAKTATSTKPPTRPNFELPGEAISRRKREEREAKLKAEQEEERKRREFKARPVRASLAPGGTTLSAEEMQQQKLRGKEIFKRESSFVSEKERERRSREEAARKAREDAAERSRKSGREWAEKQKARKMAAVGGSPAFAA
ncbi:hypothetical protein CONLIGDRAFT_435264 [Coniochaeta ligniaria NRRL 30616]|uniref:Carboxylesterase family protein n=1 Tax=Coniochaeta ligniaria NRRL 30616 TaxID=1408157 RepID=A0A1J7JIR7_9PEZI|nr:hypothetical protein CONLIGDRAFT_435264 [Coniochaeta ligniaria NRRL 30616]